MDFYLAVDGGGSKTKLALYDARGARYGLVTSGPSAYYDIGVSAAATVICEGIHALLTQAGAAKEQIKHAVFCLSCVGERPEFDAALTSTLKTVCTNAVVVNDSFGALYAAHAGNPGIVIVSGTGSIACGLDDAGGMARCGGYDPLFSDEGSAFWLGKLTMELYCKQDDGRVQRGALHEAFTKKLNIGSAFELMEWAEHTHQNGRRKVAKLQLLLETAAQNGDNSAIALYERAAQELSLLAAGVLNRLRFLCYPVSVSYAGGTFRVGNWLLEPLSRRLAAVNCTLARPLLDAPVKGAAILCLRAAGLSITEEVVAALRKG